MSSNRAWNYKPESHVQSKAGLSFDIVKLDQKLRKELADTQRVDNVQKDIFDWIDSLSPGELSLCRNLVISLVKEGKILNNSLLKDIIIFSKPKYIERN